MLPKAPLPLRGGHLAWRRPWKCPASGRPKNAYVREGRILAHLPVIALGMLARCYAP